MGWPLLLVAGLFDIAWAMSLKPTEGFTRTGPSILSVALMLAATIALTVAVRSLPTGTAYAGFTGPGSVGVAG